LIDIGIIASTIRASHTYTKKSSIHQLYLLIYLLSQLLGFYNIFILHF